ncbi:MAG TPA: NAD(P)/FAD-dependent oxidoreductase [Burkholderiales bacterium]|nr:NAD(P)/FAD-dependent oxidoreductase [Burkholderiales bacterium]
MTDTVVIGAGSNELAAAHQLLRAGRSVMVVEERKTDRYTDGWVPPQIAMPGLAVDQPDPWLRAVLPDGGTLELWRDMKRSTDAIRRLSPRDADKWPRFCERMARLAALLADLYLAPPPSLVDLRFAFKVRRLGRTGMEDLMRVLAMPAAELLDDWFENDVLKGALGALAVSDLQQGPRSAGTAFRLLHFHAGNSPGVFRAPRSNYAQIARSGLEIRQGVVQRITVRAGQATGITLDSGEELGATAVMSGADPRRTLVDLTEPGWLDPDLVRALRHIRRRGVAAHIDVELERAPDWKTLTFAPSLDYVERAYDDAKYRRISAQPCLDLAADGTRVHARFQYAPYGAEGEISPTIVQQHLPAIKRATVRSTMQLEQAFGWPQGQPHHAELSLDQALWMRPLPELAGYGTPIRGLWLCGPAMHPGAGVAGASGYNCARAMLRTL